MHRVSAVLSLSKSIALSTNRGHYSHSSFLVYLAFCSVHCRVKSKTSSSYKTQQDAKNGKINSLHLLLPVEQLEGEHIHANTSSCTFVYCMKIGFSYFLIAFLSTLASRTDCIDRKGRKKALASNAHTTLTVL